MNKFICADYLDILPTLDNSSIDLILCDLPYGQTSMSWDKKLPMDILWKEYTRILKDTGNILLFSSALFTVDLINSNRELFRYKLIWKKNVPTGMSSAKYRPMKYYEEICIFNNGTQAVYNPIMKERVGKGKACYNYEHYCSTNNHIQLNKIKKRYDPDLVQPSDVLEFNVVPNKKGKIHPTEKPVQLLEYLIRTYSNKNDLVLDNCAGSGSTALACINTKRNYICIEKDKNIYDRAVTRLDNYIVK